MNDPYPHEYLHRSRLDKPMAEIYADLDAFSWETPPDREPAYFFTFVLLPPLVLEGRFLKGILLSHDADYLLKTFPAIEERFLVLANSRFCSYPHSRSAHALCTLYPNAEREAWFRANHPDRAHQALVPIQAPDWTHDRLMKPVPNKDRDIDVLCISRLISNKNLPFLAQALKIYRRKHGMIRMTLPNGYDTPWHSLEGHELEILKQMERVLGCLADYIDLIERLPHHRMTETYSRSKCLVLASLLEGKNRALHEAMLCDTPVVVCREFNHYLRGETPICPDGAGSLAAFDPESFADTLRQTLKNADDFHPRQGYLQGFSGRRWALTVCIDRIPYYRTALEGFRTGCHLKNAWLDRASESCYGCGIETFLYGEDWYARRYASGKEAHAHLFEYFRGTMAARGGAGDAL